MARKLLLDVGRGQGATGLGNTYVYPLYSIPTIYAFACPLSVCLHKYISAWLLRFSLASKWSDTRTESLLYWSADKCAYLSISVVKVFISTLCKSVVWTVYWMLPYISYIDETICCCLLFSENKSCGWRMMRAYRSCWWATSAIWMISARCRWASASWGRSNGRCPMWRPRLKPAKMWTRWVVLIPPRWVGSITPEEEWPTNHRYDPSAHEQKKKKWKLFGNWQAKMFIEETKTAHRFFCLTSFHT